MTPQEHPLLRDIKPWSGRARAGFDVNFLGQATDVRFVAGWDTPDRLIDRDAWPPFYPANEETFELLLMLEAIRDAGDHFTMYELGAGYGRWMVAAACAARAIRPSLALRFVGVEAQPDHFRWMQQHFRDNDLDPSQHRLIEAAIVGDARQVYLVDDPNSSTYWYGQFATSNPTETGAPCGFENGRARRVKTLSLSKLLAAEKFVDLLDMDIQGAETEVVPASMASLTACVKRLFVETHSDRAYEVCTKAFSAAGWTLRDNFERGDHDTAFGRISFDDGVQTWINRHLI
jgi:FkbM family methyltransferase